LQASWIHWSISLKYKERELLENNQKITISGVRVKVIPDTRAHVFLINDISLFTWDAMGLAGILGRPLGDHRLKSASIGINDTVRGVDLMVLQSLFARCQFKLAAPAFFFVKIIEPREEIGFREDESRVRKGSSPETFAEIRHIALNL